MTIKTRSLLIGLIHRAHKTLDSDKRRNDNFRASGRNDALFSDHIDGVISTKRRSLNDALMELNNLPLESDSVAVD